MAELIFFAVIILFSVLESVARQRKQREAENEEGEEDDGVRAEVPREEVPRDRGAHGRGERTSEEPSETMIPADIWEEIAGLGTTRGEAPESEPEPEVRPAPQRPEPAPQRPEPAPQPVPAPRPEPRPSPTSSTPTPEIRDAHPVHRAHAEYGTDPSDRAPSAEDWRPAERENRNAKRVRAMLRGSEGADALKQAVILQEVLGPPAAMKDGNERP